MNTTLEKIQGSSDPFYLIRTTPHLTPILLAIFMVSYVIGSIINFVLIVVILKYRKFRCNSQYLLILSLTICDFLGCLLYLLNIMLAVLWRSPNPNTPYLNLFKAYPKLCYGFGYLNEIFFISHSFHLFLLALDRYYIVCDPIKSQRVKGWIKKLLTPRIFCILIACLWILCFVVRIVHVEVGRVELTGILLGCFVNYHRFQTPVFTLHIVWELGNITAMLCIYLIIGTYLRNHRKRLIDIRSTKSTSATPPAPIKVIDVDVNKNLEKQRSSTTFGKKNAKNTITVSALRQNGMHNTQAFHVKIAPDDTPQSPVKDNITSNNKTNNQASTFDKKALSYKKRETTILKYAFLMFLINFISSIMFAIFTVVPLPTGRAPTLIITFISSYSLGLIYAVNGILCFMSIQTLRAKFYFWRHNQVGTVSNTSNIITSSRKQ